jgi:photosystem II stability/assembly factor-like uncharacterized protein
MKILILLFIAAFVLPVFSQYRSHWDQVPEEIRKTKAFQRYEWFYRTRTDEVGMFPKEHIREQKLIEMEKITSRKNSGEDEGVSSEVWSNIGPKAIDMSSSFIPYWGKNSGRIRGLDVHPTDPNVVYIGAAAGGVWKTTNGGTTWTDLSGDLNLLTFGAIAIDPNNPNTVYAGTGETRWFFNNVTFEGDGLYKSTNGGTNWTRITAGLGTQTQFADIEVSPHNSNIILAALGSGNWNNAFPVNEGIWRSTDAGLNWQRVHDVDDAFEVAFHPNDANLAYASSGNLVAGGGFFISTNAGATWTQSNTGLPSATTIGRIQFELAPSNPSIIYSYIYSNSLLSGGRNSVVYKSTNGGANWAQISSGVNIAGTYNGTTVSDQGSYDLTLAVSPTNPDIVFFGNVEMSKTTNGTDISFVRNSSGYTGGTGAWDCFIHVDIHKIRFAPSNSSIIYAGCDGGIYKSTDTGVSWTHLNNDINTIQFYRVSSHPTDPDILYGGAQDNGNFSTSDRGATDWEFETSGDGMESFVDYANPNNIYVSTQFGNLIKSSNGGSTWFNILGTQSNTAWVAPYWQHPTISTRIFAGISQRIARSTDSGANWNYISVAITTNRITSVVQSTVNTNRMMAIASYYTTNPVHI